MLNQNYEAATFLEILDQEKRKGISVEVKFKDDFKRSLKLLRKIEEINLKLKEVLSPKKRRKNLDKKQELIQKRKKKIIKTLEKCEQKIRLHKIHLNPAGIHGKQAYSMQNTLESFLISKVLQSNIKNVYGVRQASRNATISQLKNHLQDQFPKVVIRTDLKEFYESIPQNIIINKIESDKVLSARSIDFTAQIIRAYNTIKAPGILSSRGVPRGVGISAFLAELFLRDCDNRLRDIPDCVYYARYVDDIVLIFKPQKRIPYTTLKENYFTQVKEIIESFDIKMNENKTNTFNLLGNLEAIHFNSLDKETEKISFEKRANCINFLGYKFGSTKIVSRKVKWELIVDVSDKKVEKYKEKINLAFKDFQRKKRHNYSYAFNLLFARVRYLTSNTKLTNNKSGISVGIYHSNSYITDVTSLKKMDRSLNYYISRSGLSNSEKKKLKMLSFLKGFQRRIFYKYPIKKMRYNNHNSKLQKGNRGIVRFGLAEINRLWA